MGMFSMHHFNDKSVDKKFIVVIFPKKSINYIFFCQRTFGDRELWDQSKTSNHNVSTNMQ